MHYSRQMAPNHHFMLNPVPMEPVSRTYQYRKIMKPMLERKRRARINKCLDELKDLMTGTLQADGENVSKLEKADILELTVRHLQRLREHNALFLRTSDTLNMEKFWAGFQHCAVEVSEFLSKYDQNISGDLVKHMASYIPNVPAVGGSGGAAAGAALEQLSTAAAYQRLAAADMQQLPCTRTRHSQAANDGNGKATAKSKSKSSMRLSLHPYATAAVAPVIPATKCLAGENADLYAGDDEDAGVWRPW